MKPRSFGHTLRWLVGVVVIPAVLLGVVGWIYTGGDRRKLIEVAVTPSDLLALAVVLAVVAVLWALLIVAIYRRHRPTEPGRGQRVLGATLTGMLCLAVVAPLTVGARYSMVQRDLLNTVVDDEGSATAPTIENATEKNPWGSKRRVNLLLLGGDGGVGRTGIRTDSVIVASMDTRTGATVLFSLPRNLRNVPFPDSSPLHAIYPAGFTEPGDPGESMLNAVYRNVPAAHPGALGKTGNEGADAVKLGVSGALGIDIDYYLLVNLDGFQQIVDAMGGITVNVNERVAINGETDRNIQPTGWIEPGPNQHLNGFKALWFTRGRFGSTDYKRMERQRCAINAIVKKADPINLLRRYTALASASKKILRTDIPQRMLKAFVDTALKMKDQELRSVVFQRSADFDPNDPDFTAMHAAVTKALNPVKRTPKPLTVRSIAAGRTIGSGQVDQVTPADDKTTDATDATSDCSYQPVSANASAQ